MFFLAYCILRDVVHSLFITSVFLREKLSKREQDDKVKNQVNEEGAQQYQMATSRTQYTSGKTPTLGQRQKNTSSSFAKTKSDDTAKSKSYSLLPSRDRVWELNGDSSKASFQKMITPNHVKCAKIVKYTKTNAITKLNPPNRDKIWTGNGSSNKVSSIVMPNNVTKQDQRNGKGKGRGKGKKNQNNIQKFTGKHNGHSNHRYNHK